MRPDDGISCHLSTAVGLVSVVLGPPANAFSQLHCLISCRIATVCLCESYRGSGATCRVGITIAQPKLELIPVAAVFLLVSNACTSGTSPCLALASPAKPSIAQPYRALRR